MTKIISRAILYITLVLTILFIAHYFVAIGFNDYALQTLSLTYGFNFGITVVLLVAFRRIIKKNQKQVGSAFLLTSMIKFVLFFIVIYPFVKVSGGLKSFAFGAFFIPYAACVIAEVLVTIRLLNDLDTKKDV